MPVVTETIEGPDGAPLQYVDVTVRLIASTSGEAPGYVSASDITVLGRWETRTGADGVASLTLIANSLINPAGTVYEWTRKAPGRTPVTSYISVPNGAGPYVLEDLLTVAPTALDSLFLSSTSEITLARVRYNPATTQTPSTTSNTSSDIDATNLAVTFTVPANGKVRVRLQAVTDGAGNGVEWVLREGSSEVADTRRVANRLAAATNARITMDIYVSGLTPGAVKTWKWGIASTNGTSAARIVCGGSSPPYGPAIMEVRSDPF